MITVGLFGTCGGSTWRETYKEQLAQMGIEGYDPQVMPETHGRSWCEADIELEARQLADAPILMFKVTGETAGMLSFCEIITAINRGGQFIICLIEPLNADHKAYPADDPRMMTLKSTLEEMHPDLRMPNPVYDVQRVRPWTLKAIAACKSPLVVSVTDDDEAIKRICLAANWLQAKINTESLTTA